MSYKNHTAVTTKLEYKIMYRVAFLKNLKFQNDIRDKDETIKQLTKALREKAEFPYLQSEAAN